MDSTLQKRLIGASVLIVLAIIFVPMLLDGSDPAGSEALPLVIPGMPERDFETREIPISPPAATGVADAIGVGSPVDPATVVDTGAPAAPAEDALATVDTLAPDRIDAVSGTTAAPAQDNGQVAAPVVQPEVVVPPSEVATPVAAVPAPPAQPAPVAGSVGGRFLVGLGSYSNTANANALAAQLRAAGYRILSDRLAVNGQEATRLRVGPYATRGQAEAARLAIKRLRADIAASISEVDDTPAKDVPDAPANATRTSVWAVQIGAFKVEAEAVGKRDQLRQAGFAAFVEKVNADAGVLYRVRVGPENKRADADAVKAGIKARFAIDGIVVPYP